MQGRTIIIGTRGSALARTQTDITVAALQAAYPNLAVEIKIIETQGDVNQSPIPLDTVGKGWFTKEIESALLAREIDLAVHSLKDMADEMPEGLAIGCYLTREDARDVLVTKRGESLEDLPEGAVIGTDSARRQVQMLAMRSDFVMKSMRGNVPTRLDKLTAGDYDAIILAAAGLKRLGLEDRITRIFTIDEMTPAPGQGTLALQIRSEDTELKEMLASIEDADAARAARLERSFSRAVGGGCKEPVGAYAYRDGADAVLVGMVYNEAAEQVARETLRAPWETSDDLGTMLAAQFKSALA